MPIPLCSVFVRSLKSAPIVLYGRGIWDIFHLCVRLREVTVVALGKGRICWRQYDGSVLPKKNFTDSWSLPSAIVATVLHVSLQSMACRCRSLVWDNVHWLLHTSFFGSRWPSTTTLC